MNRGFTLFALLSGFLRQGQIEDFVRGSKRAIPRNSTQVGRGPGWTRAQVKRMTAKARNRRRNKLAHRGKARRSA